MEAPQRPGRIARSRVCEGSLLGRSSSGVPAPCSVLRLSACGGDAPGRSGRRVRLTRVMRMRPTDINIAGAVDLSALRAPAAPAGSGPAPNGAGPAAGPYVIDVTEATFEEQVLRRSLAVPVVLDFWAEWCGPCKQLSPVLERLAAQDAGAWVLAKIDVDANQAIAGQLGIQSIPTVLLALGGRLVQGFTGALPERDVRSFLDQVLAAAKQAGLPGADGAPAPAADEPEPEPEVLAAEDALERGDWDGAVAAYDALLARDPKNELALGGRASVELFRRTDGVDPEAVLRAAQAAPDDVPAQLAAADFEFLADRVEEGVERLVGLVRRTSGPERDAARNRLVELFAVIDPADPRIVAGRRALASALF